MNIELENIKHIIEVLKEWFNLQEWHIRCVIEKLSDGDAARVFIDSVYLNAVISVDPENAAEEDMIWSYLIHEFVHILHSEFEMFERQYEMSEVQRSTYIHAMERAVVRTERIITGLLVSSGKIPDRFQGN